MKLWFGDKNVDFLNIRITGFNVRGKRRQNICVEKESIKSRILFIISKCTLNKKWASIIHLRQN